jgi:hypothetical protein
MAPVVTPNLLPSQAQETVVPSSSPLARERAMPVQVSSIAYRPPLFGSVARNVVVHADASVLIVRAKGSARDGGGSR